MAKIYYDNSADLALIRGKKVAILGYGSQGHAHALNLRDSGVSVQVGLPESSRSRAKATQHGFTVATPDRACAWADVIMVVTPDTGQAALYRDAIGPNLSAGNIGYKLLKSLGGATAVGPILVGMNHPVHVLEQGADVQDIVNMAAVAVIDSQNRA